MLLTIRNIAPFSTEHSFYCKAMLRRKKLFSAGLMPIADVNRFSLPIHNAQLQRSTIMVEVAHQ